MTNKKLLLGYGRRTALNLVYWLAKNNAPADAYDEVLRIVRQARDDLAAGLDPSDRLANVNGRIVEL